MAGIFLHTKLHIPQQRPDCVARPRLFHRLSQGLGRGFKVSLVCAPAGFGKTTLVCNWLAANQAIHTGWLSIDEGDNDLVVFMQLLYAALKKIAPALDESALKKLDSEIPAETLLSAWINELVEQVQEPSVLVFDDYHTIYLPAIHQAVTFFLENKPQLIHVTITSRHDPLLPLPRWRARGQVNEIRAVDLRFTGEEAAEFLNRPMGLNLSSQDIEILESRTEGWIAGLQLAAVSLQQEQLDGAPADFVRSFAGNNRYIMDYLIDEVLSRQPAGLQAFLLQTSILERMCAPLCEALTGTAAEPILAQLDRANLFLIPLDQQREWYRYHHLFAQLLQQRLVNEQGEAAAAGLHLKAATWFAAQGLIHEAVQHAALAREDTWLADLLENTLRKPAAWSRGEVNRLLGWLKKLPEAVIEARPSLAMQVARTLHLTGDTQAGVIWLKRAEHSLEDWPDSPIKDHHLGIAAANWATFHVMNAENQKACEAAERALQLLPEQDTLWRARTLHAMAVVSDELGDYQQACRRYERVVDLSRKTGNLFLALSSMGSLSAVLNRLGKLRQAEHCCQEALEIGKVNGQLTPAVSLAWMAQAGMLYERNLLDEAEKTIIDAITLAQSGGLGVALQNSTSLAMLCWCRLARGDQAGANEILQQMDSLMTHASRQWVRQRYYQQAVRASLALDMNDLAHASAWARAYEQLGPTPFNRERMDIVLARVYLREGKTEQAIELLNQLLPEAAQYERNYNRMVILIQLALAYQAAGQPADAGSSLLQAVEIAAPEGYIRMFSGEGLPLRRILEQLRQADIAGSLHAYLDQLLAAFPDLPSLNPVGLANQSLVEPLTERELEVLRYFASGRTAAEIAEALYLSPNTLKAHANTIYMKLEVHSRMQAVNKARELGLLTGAP